MIDKRRMANAPSGANALLSTFTCTLRHFHTMSDSSRFYFDLILPLNGSLKQPFEDEALAIQWQYWVLKGFFSDTGLLSRIPIQNY